MLGVTIFVLSCRTGLEKYFHLQRFQYFFDTEITKNNGTRTIPGIRIYFISPLL